jgi:hypothetical protein
VFKIENIIGRPVKMIGKIGYLLVQAIEGVAYDSPGKSAKSTSN